MLNKQNWFNKLNDTFLKIISGMLKFNIKKYSQLIKLVHIFFN